MSDENAAQASAADVTLVRRRPRRLRRAVIAIIVAIAMIIAIQVIAIETDHQIANIASYIIGAIALIFVVIQIHLFGSARGFRYAVPAVVGISLAIGSSLVRFDGFSGEMVPQFASRLDGAPELPVIHSESVPPEIDDESPAAVASSDSVGFLGNERNGVIRERQFAIPTSKDNLITLWEQGIGEGWSSFAVVGDRAVTLEQRDDQECVSCYRLADGELMWINQREARHENALGGIGPRSTPTIDSNRVYTQGATGVVSCLDLMSGEVVWSVDLLAMAGWDQTASEAAISWGRAGSPLMVDGLCVLPYGGPESLVKTGRSLIALDPADGTARWTAGEAQISYASPSVMTLAGVRQIVSVNEATVTGHAIEDGKVLWEFSWPGQSNAGANCASAIFAGEDRFVVGKGYGGGSALVEVKSVDGSLEAKPVWLSASVLKTKFTHACIDGETAYAISNGSLEAVDVASGESLWKQSRSQRFGQGQVILVDDVLVGQSETGEVVFVDASPESYVEELRMPALATKTWNIPTIAGRHLIVRNDRQAICYLLPAK